MHESESRYYSTFSYQLPSAKCLQIANYTRQLTNYTGCFRIVPQAIPGIKTYGPLIPDECNDFTFGIVANKAKGSGSNNVATEHILEFQLLPIFFDEMQQTQGVNFDNPVPKPTDPEELKRWKPKVDLCHYMQPYWYGTVSSWVTMPGFTAMRATDAAALAYPSRSQFTTEWVILEKGANKAKERVRKEISTRLHIDIRDMSIILVVRLMIFASKLTIPNLKIDVGRW